MKIAAIIIRTLVGLAFVFFGFNMIHPLSQMTPPPGDAGTYFGLLYAHGFLFYIGAFQLLGGLLTLSGRFTPLGLVILAPILVNILLFHALFGVPGIINGAALSVLVIFLIWVYRPNFNGLFEPATLK
jgi:putative oxidoreductase